MHITFYMLEKLTAAKKFYEIFPCNIQNLNAADIIHSMFREFCMQHVKFSMHISKYYMQLKLFSSW